MSSSTRYSATSLDEGRDLPEGWIDIELSDHIYIAGRIGWRGLKAEEYTSSGPLLLSVPNLNRGHYVDFSEVNHISDARFDESPEIQLQIGDTLLVKDGAGIGKVGFVGKLPQKATVNSSLLLIRPADPMLVGHYLSYFFKGPDFQKIALQRITGSTTPHLFQKDIKQFRVLVPPLPEQRRIVAKIEQLLRQVDASRERLAKIPTVLKRFRQSVLAAACSGRLTEDWREKHPEVESTHAVVERLKHERKAQTAKWLEISEVDTTVVPEVPDSWCWVNAGILYDDAGYGTSVKCEREPDGIPVLRVPNIAAGQLDLTDLKYARFSKSELSELSLCEGDLLICRTNGSLDLIGKAAVMPSLDSPYVFASYLICIRSRKSALLPKYFHEFISAPIGRAQIEDKARTTAGQFNLNLGILGGLALPLPPLEEQSEIVRRVEALFELADMIEKRVEAATKRADTLPQAILAKAFRGELVPTEAELARREGRDYEPASAVLRRIGAERETSDTVTRNGKRPRARL